MRSPEVVVVGAGIVGCALADELTVRGWTRVTVLDRGPLPTTGGSSSHAPGLVFQTNPSRTMALLARHTVATLSSVGCFAAVGGLEVATTEARWADLHRKHGLATAWGVPARLVDAREAAARHPLLDEARVLGALHTPTDGLADAPGACAALAARAAARGATFRGDTEVLDVIHSAGRVTGVRTPDGVIPADVVICAAGFWGADLGRRLGMTVPLVPMAHQYARSTPVPGLDARAALPILRHQDCDLYFRQHGDTVGVGSYAHRPMPVSVPGDCDPSSADPSTADPSTEMPSMMAFTEQDFAPSWADAIDLLPSLRSTRVVGGFNGIFSFTPDGAPLVGEHREVAGLWVAEAVWVTHAGGIARSLAEWLVDGAPSVDLREAELHRFVDAELSAEVVTARAVRSFVEVYDVIHPLDPPGEPRTLRVSPFHAHQRELGAVFGVSAGWERPRWFEANAALVDGSTPQREDWAGRHWSPIVAAEARACRATVGLVDMTALMRLEVAGPGALELLTATTSNTLDRPVGSVTYTLLLDAAGGVRSDLTVTRLAADRFQVAVSSPLDLEWLVRRAPAGTSVRDVTGATCCLGLWGPNARAVLAPLTTTDISHTGLRFFRATRAVVGGVDVLLQRVSYVGELGWEIFAAAESGVRLWEALWASGSQHGMVAVGSSAVDSLRIEKGYRNAAHDLDPALGPQAHGLGFAVRPERQTQGDPARRLACLTLDDASAVVLGHEPVHAAEHAPQDAAAGPVGHITSAAFSATVGRCVALAWLPTELASEGRRVVVTYFGKELGATVVAEPLVDPDMDRIRR